MMFLVFPFFRSGDGRAHLRVVMQRDDAALIQAVFYSFAIFPEDCEVPKAVLDAFAPTLVRVAAESATKEEPGKTTPRGMRSYHFY